MMYKFTIQTTDASDYTATTDCYFDSMEELYKTFQQATDDDEDFIITNIEPCAEPNLSYKEVSKRLRTMGEDWEDKAIWLMNELYDTPNSEEARKALCGLRITAEDLFAWAAIEY